MRSLKSRESPWLRHIFLRLHADSFRKLVLGTGHPVCGVATAAHNSGIERPELAFWLDPNRTARSTSPKYPRRCGGSCARPRSGHEPRLEHALCSVPDSHGPGVSSPRGSKPPRGRRVIATDDSSDMMTMILYVV